MCWSKYRPNGSTLKKNLTIYLFLQCNPGVGLKAFFDMVHLNPKKLVLFGAACSPVTDQIAKAARHWNLVQVSCVLNVNFWGIMNLFFMGFVWVSFNLF